MTSGGCIRLKQQARAKPQFRVKHMWVYEHTITRMSISFSVTLQNTDSYSQYQFQTELLRQFYIQNDHNVVLAFYIFLHTGKTLPVTVTDIVILLFHYTNSKINYMMRRPYLCVIMARPLNQYPGLVDINVGLHTNSY